MRTSSKKQKTLLVKFLIDDHTPREVRDKVESIGGYLTEIHAHEKPKVDNSDAT